MQASVGADTDTQPSAFNKSVKLQRADESMAVEAQAIQAFFNKNIRQQIPAFQAILPNKMDDLIKYYGYSATAGTEKKKRMLKSQQMICRDRE